MKEVLPRYKKEPSGEDLPGTVEAPHLELCQLVDGRLLLPSDLRQHFLQCPIFGGEWRQMLVNFDRAWGAASSASQASTTTPSSSGDTGSSSGTSSASAAFMPNEPTSLDKVKEKYGEPIAEVPVPECPASLLVFPGSVLFACAKEATTLKESEGPLLCHGPGSWLTHDKATKFEQSNPGKGLFRRFETDEAAVLVEDRGLGLDCWILILMSRYSNPFLDVVHTCSICF